MFLNGHGRIMSALRHDQQLPGRSQNIIEAIQKSSHIMCAYRGSMKNLCHGHPPPGGGFSTQKRLFEWALGVGARRNNCMKDDQPVPFFSKPGIESRRAGLKKIRDIVAQNQILSLCWRATFSKHRRVFYATGIFICYGYGLSETTATVTCHEPVISSSGWWKAMPASTSEYPEREILSRAHVMKDTIKAC